MALGFPSPGVLVPHRAPMLLLTEVERQLEDGIICTGTVSLDHPLADRSRAPAILGVELAAQAAAAHQGLRGAGEAARPLDSGPGYLVSISACRFSVPFLNTGQALRATVRLVGVAGPLRMYTGLVEHADDRGRVVTCRFSTYGATPTRARESRTTGEASDE